MTRVRKVYESWGSVRVYRLPGLSHRTGNGIAWRAQSWFYLVHGETTPLASGMCCSDEPGYTSRAS